MKQTRTTNRIWFILNQNGDRCQNAYEIHTTFESAVKEAQRLAMQHKGNKFLLFEAVGGFIRPDDGNLQPVEIIEPLPESQG